MRLIKCLLAMAGFALVALAWAIPPYSGSHRDRDEFVGTANKF